MQKLSPFVLCSLLALPVVAQDDVATTAAPKTGPVLVIKTAELEPVMGLGMALGLMQEPPELGEGEHYVLSLDRKGKPALATGSGKIRFFEVTADPSGLMEVYAEQIGEVRGMAQGLGVMTMAQQGIDAQAAMQIVKTIFEFPNQLEQATLVLLTNPEEIELQGLELEFGLTAKVGSECGKIFTALRPGNGAPVLAGAGAAIMDMTMSLDPKGMSTLFQPFLDFGLSFSYPDQEARAQAKEVWAKTVTMYDGGIAFAIGKDMSMNGVYGFLDGPALAELFASEDYAKMMAAQKPNRDLSIEITPDAFTHQGGTFMKMVMTNDGPPNPMFVDDQMVMFTGPVGKYLVMGGTEAKAKAIADAAAAGFERKVLAGGSVFRMKMGVRDFLGALGTVPVDEMPPEFPDDLLLDVVPSGRTVTFKLEMK